MVGGDAVHIARLLSHAAKEITAADDQCDLHAQLMDILDFAGDGMDTAGFNPKTLVPGQRLAGEFEKDAFEGKHAASV